jgi:hypothetical protein
VAPISLVGQDNDRCQTGKRPAGGIVNAAACAIASQTTSAPACAISEAADGIITCRDAVAADTAVAVATRATLTTRPAIGDV